MRGRWEIIYATTYSSNGQSCSHIRHKVKESTVSRVGRHAWRSGGCGLSALRLRSRRSEYGTTWLRSLYSSPLSVSVSLSLSYYEVSTLRKNKEMYFCKECLWLCNTYIPIPERVIVGGYLRNGKCKQAHPVFERGSTGSFDTMITVIPRASPLGFVCRYLMHSTDNELLRQNNCSNKIMMLDFRTFR